MNKRNLPLHGSMGPAILNKLREFTDLPTHGYVAGQAVASAVSELFGDGRAVVYNDIDVFRTQTEDEHLIVSARYDSLKHSRSKPAIETCMFTTQDLVMDYGELKASSTKRYEVFSTSRRGLLNEVYCGFKTTNGVKFLETFDINAVQAGVDLATETFIWTPSFEKFTHTRQLDVVTLHTPFHSLLRYLQKREELEGTYGNDSRIIEMLTAVYRTEERQAGKTREGTLREYTDMRWHFGEAYRIKLAKVINQVTPFFEVCTQEMRGYDVTSLVPRFDMEKDLYMHGENLVHTLPKLSRALREKHTKGMQGRLNYLASKATTVTPGFTASCWEAHDGEDYAQGNVTPGEMAQLDKVLAEHNLARHVLPLSTLSEQWKLVRQIKKEVSQRGLWVYGALEQCDSQVWTSETLLRFLDDTAVLLAQTLSTSILPPLVMGQYLVQPLTTGMQLAMEGQELHHCVGGYAKSVKVGSSIIVSMRKGTHASNWTSLEFRRSGAGWQLSQHRGLVNRIPTAEESELGTTYGDYLNLGEVLGTVLATQLIHRFPLTASILGGIMTKVRCKRKSGSSLIARLRMCSGKLADTLMLPSRLYSKKGTYYSSYHNPVLFWGACLAQTVVSLGSSLQIVAGRFPFQGVASKEEPAVTYPNNDDFDDAIPF
ncbi:MAG: PcfJ domain-containing protein [Agitococcus sp.]|nr:PcfJ domain-containing protein [Agitococcus sp.]